MPSSSDDAISFFHRCDRLSLGAISDSEVAKGLSLPISQHDGEIPNAVLEEAVRYVAGYPYKLQMLGHHLWVASEDTSHCITEDDLEVAKARVDHELDKHIYQTIWKLVSVPSRNFVQAALECGGTSTLQDLQKRLMVGMSDVERCRDELASHGLVEHDNGDWVEITNTIPGHVLIRYLARRPVANADFAGGAGGGIQDFSALSDIRPPEPVNTDCGLWMPRKRTNCVLPSGHKGRCRSKTA